VLSPYVFFSLRCSHALCEHVLISFLSQAALMPLHVVWSLRCQFPPRTFEPPFCHVFKAVRCSLSFLRAAGFYFVSVSFSVHPEDSKKTFFPYSIPLQRRVFSARPLFDNGRAPFDSMLDGKVRPLPNFLDFLRSPIIAPLHNSNVPSPMAVPSPELSSPDLFPRIIASFPTREGFFCRCRACLLFCSSS